MFEPSPEPRLFGLPPGADFPLELLRGLRQRLADQPPEALARVEIYVNTRRMQRRIRTLFANGPATLLPRIRLVTDLAHAPLPDLPDPVSPLRRRLELSQLVRRLLEQDRTFAPKSAAYDLAESLAKLMDEMQGEGVTPEDLRKLDVSDASGHWARSLAFLDIARHWFAEDAQPDVEARQRRAVLALAESWKKAPPDHPVIVAGSTGSRGATALFMEAVARLPKGAVILPGFDFELPASVWTRMDQADGGEDHPQFRFARLAETLALDPKSVRRWTDDRPREARAKLVSLALRPAPVTDQWRKEGRDLPDLREATEGMTLIEASSPRDEASAIALLLRHAVEAGQSAALITPDRNLSRQVTAALDRWRIEPDDSAGRPLAHSVPGRFLRHVCAILGQPVTPEALLSLLKHPICHSGADRGPHLRHTRELELWMRRGGPPVLDRGVLFDWAGTSEGRIAWVEWLVDCLSALDVPQETSLGDFVGAHLRGAEPLAAGPGATGSGELWLAKAGAEAERVMGELAAEADAGGTLSLRDYTALFEAILTREEVRDPMQPHPGVMIWGTLEARVQGADLVILGGLNDGTWPDLPPPDPWLNRQMRHDAGLLVPERRIGLAAHDFQQAISAREVVLTRATRDAEAETVVSRWLNRLLNLMSGLPDRNGPEAVRAMRRHGRRWLDHAADLDRPLHVTAKAPRPAPCPPVAMRPDTLSVTQIQTLIRDPYAIYARHVLELKALDPLRPAPDALTRGTVIHDIFEAYLRGEHDPSDPDAAGQLMALADNVLAAEVPWLATRRFWRARLERVADWFIAGELDRRAEAEPALIEERGRLAIPGVNVILTGKADRIDRRADGRLIVYDYKTGNPPSDKSIKHFDQQLLLEAVMAEAGAFSGIAKATVAEVAYIGLGTSPKLARHVLRDPAAEEPLDPDVTLQQLRALMNAFAERRKGYLARRAMHKMRWNGDYDHLARFGEWDDSSTASPEDVG